MGTLKTSDYGLVGKFPLHTTSGPTRGITAVDYDHVSGGFAVTGGVDGKFRIFDCEQSVQIFGSKQSWSPILEEEAGWSDVPGTTTKGASCLCFGNLAKNVFVGSNSDHNLRV